MIHTVDSSPPFARLHGQVLRALTERSAEQLSALLADDVALHLPRLTRQGRLQVLLHLEDWLGHARIECAPPCVRALAHGLVALDADWLFDCPERGFYVERYTSLFALREGRWQVVQWRLFAASAR